MTDYALRAKEYAKFERERQAFLIQQTEASVQLIFSRNAAAQARDNCRQALDTELLSNGEYAAKEIFRALFSRNTVFFLIGSCILLLPIWATLDLQMDITSMVICWLLLMAGIRVLFTLIQLNTSGELARYGRFRTYMEKNRASVQKEWEEKRAEVAALNAKIADAEQCNIPAEYQHIAGNLLYYIKSGAATSMNEAIRCHNDKLEHDTTMQLLENIYRQNEKIEEGISKTQSDQAFLEGLMVYHTFFQHR